MKAHIKKFSTIFKKKLKQIHACLPKNKFWRFVIYAVLILIALVLSLYLWAFALASTVALSLWGAIIAPILAWILSLLSALGLTSLFTAIYGALYAFFAGIILFLINTITAALAWLGTTYLGAFVLQFHAWLMPIISKVMPFVSAGKYSKKFWAFVKKFHKV